MELKIRDIIDESWALIKSDWAFFIIGYSIIVTLGSMAGIFVMAPLMVGFIACIVKRMIGEKAELGDIFTLGFDKFLPSFLVNLLIGLFMVPCIVIICFGCFFNNNIPLMVSMILLGLLGIFCMTILFHFTMMVVANDDEPQVFSCLKESCSLVLDNIGLVLLTIVVSLVLNILGCLPCFLGLMVTAPLTVIIQIVLFSHLKTGLVEPIFKPKDLPND